MDVLEQLRSDMDDAGYEAECMSEGIIAACLDILDEFIAGYEVVEMVRGAVTKGLFPLGYCPGQRIIIIVPRERKPSLLEAAEPALMLMREMQAGRRRGNWAAFDGALDALAAAIKEERER